MKPRGVVLAGLPTGELYAAGYECEPLGHGGPIVERWEPKQARGVVEALPRPESGRQPAPRGVLARSPGDVLVYGGEGSPPAPYLARFDGKGWSVDTPPFGAGVDTLGAADDGTLWAVAAGGDTCGKKAGAAPAWEKVPRPSRRPVHAAWPRGDGRVRPGGAPDRRARRGRCSCAGRKGPRPEVIGLPAAAQRDGGRA